MASKKTSLKKVLEKFPEHHLLIEELYRESDSFRSLCEDYVECMEIIKNIDYSECIIRAGYKQEYETLLHELEEELLTKLSKYENP
jgi:hypothetical protein